MGTTEVFDSEEVALLLLGSDEELDRGLDRINQFLCLRHCSGLKNKFKGRLKAEDLDDIWQDTLLAVFKAVKSGSFDLDGRLESYVWKIALNKAIDLIRRTGAEKRAHQEIARALQGTRLGMWTAQMTPAERVELNRLIVDAINTLPEKQRLTMTVWAFNFPESKSMEVLVDLVSRETGETETRASVKGALREARNKVRPILKRRGLEK